MDIMKNELKMRRYKYHDGFVDDVMARIRNERIMSAGYLIQRWQPVIAWGTAACLVLFICALLLAEGNLSSDAVLGLSEFSEIELSDLLAGN